ncbi:hypothetical protein CTAM01_01246 [Colletotrichum tamarilloi]|uniref:Uncharacterized protein n=1 Tax=Colletotrichum tamarilloi TaxID=1209934 RepID=A0ABQ9RRV0_9PEZI|nr:uncharacterized protein CTAM01_01246 [Colletotrichum tamarilloi]KAK1510673.1 hypothetical protein CTAM01_01246 [Colletotrichum tamarilloi]
MSKTPRMWNLRFVSARAESQDFWESWVAPLHVHFLQWGTDWELFDFHEPMSFSFYFEWGENADGTKRGSGVCVRIHTSYV